MPISFVLSQVEADVLLLDVLLHHHELQGVVTHIDQWARH
jgi:hypothetical protein